MRPPLPGHGIALALTLAASLAVAEEEQDEASESLGPTSEDLAREWVREGVELFGQDRWGEAVEVFREAEKALRE